MLMFLSEAGDELNQLADATPDGKYAWPPAAGVRSTAEVFMRAAGANFGIPNFRGVESLEGFGLST